MVALLAILYTESPCKKHTRERKISSADGQLKRKWTARELIFFMLELFSGSPGESLRHETKV